MNKKIIWGVVTIILLILIAWKISVVSSPIQLQNREIKIGAILPLTGPVAGLGEAMQKGYEWKVDELNKNGKNFKLVIEDSHSNPKDAVTAFQKLTSIDDVPVIFTTMSAVGMTLKPMTEQKGIVLWADAAHPLLTRDADFVLRHSNTSMGDGEILASKIISLGKKRTAIIYQNDDWGQAASKILSEKLAENKIFSVLEPVDPKTNDFRASLTKVTGEKIDSLVTMIAGPASGLLIKQVRELGFKGDIVSSVGIVLTPDAQKLAGEYLKGTYYQTYFENADFDRDYRARFNTDPAPFTHITYTDIELLDSAIDATHSTKPRDIVTYIKNLKEFKGKYESVEISNEGDIIVPTEIKQF